MSRLLAFVTGGLLVAVVVLTIHDQQTISTLKRQHQRLKGLEQRVGGTESGTGSGTGMSSRQPTTV